MSKSNLLLAITNGAWLIEPSAIHQFGPVVKSLLERDFNVLGGEAKTPSVTFIDAKGAVSFSKGSSFNEAPQDSTAVISITGAIMKQDNCGDPGSASLTKLLKQADNHPNISSIVLKVDSPGGTVAGTEDFAKAVKNTSKPVVTYIDGMMASACYWIGSQADEIYAGNKTDQIGSIGTMMSFADVQPMWEKEGVVFHEVYATASKDKNKDYAEARKGNYKGVIERLDEINNIFLSSVKEARGAVLNAKETLTGKVFMADQAIEVGLIDGIKSFEEVVARAQELASKQNQSTNNTNQSTNQPMKHKTRWAAISAFMASAFPAFKAEDEFTEDHIESMNTELATLATVKADLQTATELANTTAETLRTAQEKVTALEKTNGDLTAKVAELGKLNPGATETNKEGDDTTSADTNNDWQAELAKLPHNQAVDANFLLNKPSAKK